MKLTQDNIQFIDTYLANSDVKYIDIRLEMVDHVATAIEAEMAAGDTRDFYYIFKDYMVANKRLLLNDNRQFLKTTDKKLTILLFKMAMTWPAILAFVMLFGLFYFISIKYEIFTLRLWLGVLPYSSFVIFALGYWVVLKKFNFQRFSSMERLGSLLLFVFQVFQFGWIISKDIFLNDFSNWVILFISVLLTLLFALSILTIKLFKEYNLKSHSFS